MAEICSRSPYRDVMEDESQSWRPAACNYRDYAPKRNVQGTCRGTGREQHLRRIPSTAVFRPQIPSRQRDFNVRIFGMKLLAKQIAKSEMCIIFILYKPLSLSSSCLFEADDEVSTIDVLAINGFEATRPIHIPADNRKDRR